MTREKPWGSEPNKKRSQAYSIHQGKPRRNEWLAHRGFPGPQGHAHIWLPCPLASREVFYPVSKICIAGMTGLTFCRVHNNFPTYCQNVSGRVTVILFHEDVTHGAIAGNSDVSCQCLPLRNGCVIKPKSQWGFLLESHFQVLLLIPEVLCYWY